MSHVPTHPSTTFSPRLFDGTIRLVSKLCFYCLLLSILWGFEPYYAPPSEDAMRDDYRSSSADGGGGGGGDDGGQEKKLKLKETMGTKESGLPDGRGNKGSAHTSSATSGWFGPFALFGSLETVVSTSRTEGLWNVTTDADQLVGAAETKQSGGAVCSTRTVTLVTGGDTVLGFKLMPNPLTGLGIVVKSVDAEGPAKKEGLKAGDVIATINGTPVASLNAKEMRPLLLAAARMVLTIETSSA